MRFFLAGRDRVTGSVRLVSETTFQNRQDALDSLGMLLPADGSFDGLDLFVGDIEQSTPVVVYKPVVVEPLPGLLLDEPIADAWESPADAAPAELAPLDEPRAVGVDLVEGPYADAVIAELESVVAELATESGPEAPEPMPLMEALRRAADRMEAEGIVAPEPVGETAVATTSEPVAPETPADAEALVAAETEGPAGEEPPTEERVGTPAAAQWPWEAAEAPEPAATAKAETAGGDAEAISVADLTAALQIGSVPLLSDEDLEAPAAFAPVGIEEPAPQVDGMLTAPDDEGFVPKPVIMGDYGAMVPGDVAVESSPEPEVPETPAQETEGAIVEPVPETASEATAAEASDIEEPVLGETVAGEVPEESMDVLPAEPMGVAAETDAVEPAEPMGSLDGDVDRAREDAASAEPAVAEAPEEATDDLPTEPAAAETSEPVDDLLAAIGEPAAPASETKGYSLGGLDMNAYTCEDCVYVGTCPKANEDSPATCGSFQWKSV